MTATVKSVLEAKGRSVIALTGKESLLEASTVLAKHKVGSAVVLSAEQKLLGIFSERDLIRMLGKYGQAALLMNITEAMTSEVSVCKEADPIESLMKRMTDGRFRHLPVVENHRVVGMISIGDVVKSRMTELEGEAGALREYINQ